MKICIIEDNQSLLENLHRLLAGEPGFTVTGSYPSAEAALRALPWPDTDIMLADIDLPGLSGVDLIRKVHPQMPRLQILVHTSSENRDTVYAALKAGAAGYFLKGCPPRDLIAALRSLDHGGVPMSPRIARKVIRELQGPDPQPEQTRLTQREQGILSSLALGRSYPELGQVFGITPHTLHTHIQQVYQKLHAAARAEAR